MTATDWWNNKVTQPPIASANPSCKQAGISPPPHSLCIFFPDGTAFGIPRQPSQLKATSNSALQSSKGLVDLQVCTLAAKSHIQNLYQRCHKMAGYIDHRCVLLILAVLGHLYFTRGNAKQASLDLVPRYMGQVEFRIFGLCQITVAINASENRFLCTLLTAFHHWSLTKISAVEVHNIPLVQNIRTQWEQSTFWICPHLFAHGCQHGKSRSFVQLGFPISKSQL